MKVLALEVEDEGSCPALKRPNKEPSQRAPIRDATVHVPPTPAHPPPLMPTIRHGRLRPNALTT